MAAIVAGVYKQGKVELLETPTGIREGRVRVVLIEADAEASPRPLTFGKYRTGTPSSPEDFKAAEWPGESR